MHILSATNELRTPTAIALGNFDGIHRGHQRVLQQLVRLAQASHPVLHPAVVSFTPHPRTFFSGQSQPLLTPATEKAIQLEHLNVEQLVLLPFTTELVQLSPEEFVTHILRDRLHVHLVSVGADYRFGYQRQGDVDDLKRLGKRHGFSVAIADLLKTADERISSSAIRRALGTGNLTLANQLLGRPYALSGAVVSGQQLGRTLGFPTANLALPADKLWPKYGVYGGWAELSCLGDPIAAVLNVGDRPTVNGLQPTIEVHLLDWSGDLYGQSLTMNLVHYLRPEQKFAGVEALKKQIQADCQQARQLLSRAPTPAFSG